MLQTPVIFFAALFYNYKQDTRVDMFVNRRKTWYDVIVFNPLKHYGIIFYLYSCPVGGTVIWLCLPFIPPFLQFVQFLIKVSPLTEWYFSRYSSGLSHLLLLSTLALYLAQQYYAVVL